jgi:hypothetical protein
MYAVTELSPAYSAWVGKFANKEYWQRCIYLPLNTANIEKGWVGEFAAKELALEDVVKTTAQNETAA